VKIVSRRTADLIPYENNARQHSDDQIEQIAASIEEFGWMSPLLIDGTNGIIAGHARWLAARRLAMPRVPCIEHSHLTDAQRRAYVLADNKLTLNATWDEAMLALELERLDTTEFDLSLIGFNERELSRLLDGLGEGGDASSAPIDEHWAVIIDCTDEADQVALIERLQAEGRTVRGVVG
jgi:ParB-like chromosome segregation protein Spo0J